MQTEKSSVIFLKAFNTGAFLTLISTLQLLMTSQSVIHYIMVLVMILTNGIVIGLVTQFLRFQMTVTRNMVHAFVQADGHIPPKLLKMRHNNVKETLLMMVGIQANLQKNMMIAGGLMILLMLSIMLPISYSFIKDANTLFFTVGWSLWIFGRSALRFGILLNNTRFLSLKMTQFHRQYQSQLNLL